MIKSLWSNKNGDSDTSISADDSPGLVARKAAKWSTYTPATYSKRILKSNTPCTLPDRAASVAVLSDPEWHIAGHDEQLDSTLPLVRRPRSVDDTLSRRQRAYTIDRDLFCHDKTNLCHRLNNAVSDSNTLTPSVPSETVTAGPLSGKVTLAESGSSTYNITPNIVAAANNSHQQPRSHLHGEQRDCRPTKHWVSQKLSHVPLVAKHSISQESDLTVWDPPLWLNLPLFQQQTCIKAITITMAIQSGHRPLPKEEQPPTTGEQTSPQPTTPTGLIRVTVSLCKYADV
jgi:hypothetical protein